MYYINSTYLDVYNTKSDARLLMNTRFSQAQRNLSQTKKSSVVSCGEENYLFYLSTASEHLFIKMAT